MYSLIKYWLGYTPADFATKIQLVNKENTTVAW